jgi:arginyl-tRNA synthetase
MTTLQKAKSDVIDAVKAALPEGTACDAGMLEKPPQKEMGDFAFPCFALSKALKKAPQIIAQEVAARVTTGGFIASASALGPYVNITLDKAMLTESLLREVLGAPDAYGSAKPGSSGRTVMIEYGSLNTHKEFHVGHLRNIVLGLAVENLARVAGDRVIPVSYIGDIGAHVAKCLWAYRTFHKDDVLPENKGKYLGGIYSEATRRVEEDETLKEAIADVQRKLEARDPEWQSLWEVTRQWCLDELNAAFFGLGVKFERMYFESEVEQPGKDLVADLRKKGIAKEGERGATIVDLETPEDLGVFLVLKGDGAALYSTKELALAQLKQKEFGAIDESIHVVDARQSLYFKQFFATLKRLGFTQAMTHLSYEFVTLKEGAMSSRKGNIVPYEDFRDEMIRRTGEESRSRHEDWDAARVKEAAWTVAEGALKFGMLKQDVDRAIVFDLDEALSFEGFTGPYLQYAHARMASILQKAGKDAPTAMDGTDDQAEYDVLRVAADFPQVVADAAAQHRPSLLAQFLFEFAQAANAFYRDVPVLTAPPEDRARRLAIVRALKATLKNGLALLGIRSPEEM